MYDPVTDAVDDLDRDCSPERGSVGTSACPEAVGGSVARFSAPADLLAFVRGRPVREAALALKLGRTQINRIANGYWPADARKIVAAWQAYKGAATRPATSWFLRRVQADGQLRHGRHAYGAAGLGARVGELLAVARAADGSLLAQSLELPVERFTLARLEAQT